MNYEELENKICNFEMYLKQTMDLLKDAYRWNVMYELCEDETMKSKYKQVSDTLFDMFMVEHNNLGQMFKK